MRGFAVLSALMGAAMAAPTTFTGMRINPNSMGKRQDNPNGFTILAPDRVEDEIIVDKDNTLNGTTNNFRIKSEARDPIPGSLEIALVNNFGGGAVNAYISGADSDGAVTFVGADGTLHYPTAAGSGTPVPVAENIAIPLGGPGETTTITIPISMTSGRIYFAEGDLQFFMVAVEGGGDGVVQPAPNNLLDPSRNVNWGFVELTYTKELAIYANISYVDFIGMILSMFLENTDGTTQQTIGLGPTAVNEVCNGLVEQNAADAQPWNRLCIANQDGVVLRVLAPQNLMEIDNAVFAEYWDQYADDVWARYSSEQLIINTQNENGDVACQVVGDELQCEGDNRGYSKPTAVDIWGCDRGPFGKQPGDNGVHLAVIPRLCAAFVRTTLLLAGGERQPELGPESYYSEQPTNHYSRLIHENEVDGRGYAFPYDDVNPDGSDDASGLVSSGNPQRLTVFVGGGSP